MVNMLLSYQWRMVPMTRGSFYRVATHGSYTKKTNLCFSTPLLLKRKMPSINRSPSSLLASPSKANSHPLMMIPPDEEEEDGRSLCRFYDYVNKKVIKTNIKILEEFNHAICIGSSHGLLAYISRLDCSVFLWSPFTTTPLISLPPIHTLPSMTVIPREDADEDEILKRYEGDTLCHKWKSTFKYDDDSSPNFGFKVEWDYPDQSQSFYTRNMKIAKKIRTNIGKNKRRIGKKKREQTNIGKNKRKIEKKKRKQIMRKIAKKNKRKIERNKKKIWKNNRKIVNL